MNCVLLNALRIDSATKATLFYIEVFSVTAGAVLTVADGLDAMFERLIENDKPIPQGPFPRGIAIERIAGANLGGNVEGIDHYENSGAIQVKSYASNTPEELAGKIKGELERLRTVSARTVGGQTASGVSVSYAPGAIQATGLLVAIPEDQAGHAFHPMVRSILVSYRRNYNSLVRIAPVRGWVAGGKK